MDGAVDPRRFRLYATGELRSAALGLRAAIVGASHWLEVRADDGPPLTELVVCADGLAGSRDTQRLIDLDAPVARCTTSSLRYRFVRSVETGRAAGAALSSLEARISRAAARAEEIGLSYTFPAAGRDAGSLEPRTLVWARLVDAGLGAQARTAHVYPNDAVVVLTETRIETPAREEWR